MLAPSKIYAVNTKAAPLFRPAVHEANVCPSDETLRVFRRTANIRLFKFKVVEDVQSQGIDHDTKKQHHTHHLSIFYEFVTGFTAGDHFNQGKKRVTTVESGNRQYVHERQQDAEDTGERPETLPIPFRREYAGNTDDTAKRVLRLDL